MRLGNRPGNSANRVLFARSSKPGGVLTFGFNRSPAPAVDCIRFSGESVSRRKQALSNDMKDLIARNLGLDYRSVTVSAIFEALSHLELSAIELLCWDLRPGRTQVDINFNDVDYTYENDKLIVHPRFSKPSNNPEAQEISQEIAVNPDNEGLKILESVLLGHMRNEFGIEKIKGNLDFSVPLTHAVHLAPIARKETLTNRSGYSEIQLMKSKDSVFKLGFSKTGTLPRGYNIFFHKSFPDGREISFCSPVKTDQDRHLIEQLQQEIDKRFDIQR